MKNVFIVPTGSNLISKTNINRTLVDGVPAKTIRRFVEQTPNQPQREHPPCGRADQR